MYPGNHTDSEILSVPRNLKTRPGAPETHLAYITDDEADLLEIYKPDTPHKGPHDVPNYDSFAWDAGGNVVESGSGGDWSPGGGGGWTSDGSGGGGFSEDVSSPSQDHYTPPEDYYGANQTAVVPGQTVYATTSVNPNSNIFEAIQGMDPNTLAFYGYTIGSTMIPNELLNAVAQGSIVSGNEAVESETGSQVHQDYITTWSNLEDLTLQAMQGNQYAQDQLAQNTLFPGGYHTFNAITSQPFVIPYSGGSGSSGGPGPHYGGWGYGYGGGRGGSGGGGGGYQPQGSYGDAYMRNPWGQSEIQRRWINQLRGMNRGGIVSLC